MNLLQETIDLLEENGKTPADVLFINSVGHYGTQLSFSWEEFSWLADDDYYSGHGGVDVNPSLEIVGDSWWLERYEYDGSEEWHFKTIPSKFNSGLPLKEDLFNDGFKKRYYESQMRSI